MWNLEATVPLLKLTGPQEVAAAVVIKNIEWWFCLFGMVGLMAAIPRDTTKPLFSHTVKTDTDGELTYWSIGGGDTTRSPPSTSPQ